MLALPLVAHAAPGDKLPAARTTRAGLNLEARDAAAFIARQNGWKKRRPALALPSGQGQAVLSALTVQGFWPLRLRAFPKPQKRSDRISLITD